MELEQSKPSRYGFRNIQPRTREERREMHDKVAIERKRINDRVGVAARMHRANAPDVSVGLTSCGVDAAGYISNFDRFHTDTAGEEMEQRQGMIQRQKKVVEFRRNQAAVREEDRWRQMDEMKQREEEHWERVRAEGLKAQKNVSGVAYDITNLQYKDSRFGDEQKYSDDLVRYRAQARARNLVIQGDSRAPYDIINGGERNIPEPARRPKPPHSISGGGDSQIRNNNNSVPDRGGGEVVLVNRHDTSGRLR